LFDPRHFEASKYGSASKATKRGIDSKTAKFRTRFLSESVLALRNELRLFGSELLVAFDTPGSCCRN
jgi:hypothetical protein